MEKYNHKKIEKKWQNVWDESEIYQAKDSSKKPKYYCLIEFPYPSGAGLHVGHLRSHIAIDIVARKKRMDGFNVMYPIGWDAFGLPTENFAIKTKTHPKVVTKNNIKNYNRQIKSYGPSFDWSREINTTDPEYYKWTQWIFLKLFNSFYDEKLDKARLIEELKVPKNFNEFEKKRYIDNHRLAYEKEMAINWCPSCKIGLANEEVVNGNCERCGALAERKVMRQWMLRITKYADRLIKDLKTVDYLEKIKSQQINWIGKSEGVTIKFKVKSGKIKDTNDCIATSKKTPHDNNEIIEVFTTRPDTLFGCTYIVLSPEHPLIEKYKNQIENFKEVEKYQDKASNKSDLERTDLAKEKTGVELKGIEAINPANNEEIPIWIADYVLASYGTGAIMAVPAHDERDFEFAEKFGIAIRDVVAPFFQADIGNENALRPDKKTVRRRLVTAFVKHWKEDKYLCLDWKKFKWHTPIIGGIEGGETPEEAGLREIREETGFQNMKFVHYLGGELHNSFFARHKDENRYSIEYGVLFELIDDKWEKPSEEEIKNHKAVWINAKEMETFLNLESKKILWHRLNGNFECFKGDGVNINSGFLDGMETIKAKKEISNWLVKNKLGQKAVNFKLRDWIFSRQHYWGEPIPIIKCRECGLKKLNIKMELNFRVNKAWNQIIDNKKTIETRALNPQEKDKFFGDIKVGDLVRFNNKNTQEFEIVRINKVYNFKNLSELFETQKIVKKIFTDVKIKNISELKKCFSFTEDYLDRIEKNGLVGWEFEKIDITENISLSEKELPLELPNVKNYEPTETGESPLANIKKWVEIKCPICGGNAKRETDTMPNWAGSSWYFLRYTDPDNSKEFASQKNLQQWMPVDLYNGGMEHTTLHLLYSRFWHKFLFDLEFVQTSEPYKMRRSHGMVLAEDGQKMSKSRGNVVNPDEVIGEYGADTVRLYEMFMGPYSDAIPWNTTSLIGMNRFLQRIWNLQSKISNTKLPKKETILIATNNPGKLKELKRHFKNFQIISLNDIDKSIEEPEENEKTFADNSLLKARYYAQKTGYLTVADDSGLCVNALDGRPGVFSSRYAEGNDKKGCVKLLKELEGLSDRSAHFEAVVTIYDSKKDEYHQFEGQCDGEILRKFEGDSGFGYDPIFMPNGFAKSFGQCSIEEKYLFDHRQKATKKLIAYLENNSNNDENKIESLIHKTIKKVSEDIDNLKFNTAISQLMILANEIEKEDKISSANFKIFLNLLSPFVPHITEEIWKNLDERQSIHLQTWPQFNPQFIKDTEINFVIQINGKLRDQIIVPTDISKEEAKKLALESEKVQKWVAGKEIRKVFFVKGRLVNIVI